MLHLQGKTGVGESPWDRHPWSGAMEVATASAALLAPWGSGVSLMPFKVSHCWCGCLADLLQLLG